MIKFFRHIRQKLLAERRLSGYLAYAIGEIILVVIGILIALQINTWNEENKLEKSNRVLLKKLVGELDLNMDRLMYLDTSNKDENGVSKLDRILANADTALHYMTSGLDTSGIVWMLETRQWWAFQFNLHSSVYQEMISTGRLYTLEPDSLIQQIETYYKSLEQREFYLDKMVDGVHRHWEDCKYGEASLETEFNKYGVDALDHHQWVFDRHSENYLDLQQAVKRSSIVMHYEKAELKSQLKLSQELKNQIENVLAQDR
ncbi:DUF6090 family protein [Cryomorphaceae bacterium 1068]|nr:DUF6090 family protein [Cryomorphaceae bacterium 1068]